jgi:hypothetical protein
LPRLPVIGSAGRGGETVTAHADPERELLTAALRGGAGAAATLTRALADLVWTACLRVTQDRAETESAFRDVMAALRADGFARLKGFDGRARVRIYAALVVRDLLSERVVKLLALNADAGWRAFEAFFADDMRRIILRNLPGKDHQSNREDAYQSVCEALLKHDLQRLRAYSGRGSPSGFILHVIENLSHRLRTNHLAAPASSGCDPAAIDARSIGVPAALLGAALIRSTRPACPPAAR